MDVTFSDYVKLLIYLKDKNTLYKYSFFAVNCNLDDMKKVYELTDEEIETNVNFWSNVLKVESKWNDYIGGVVCKKVEDLTTEEWMQLSNVIENAQHVEQSFYAIISTLTGIDIEGVKILNYLEAAENINFFLQNFQRYIQNLIMSSKLQTINLN